MEAKKKNDLQATERIQRLANQNFNETDFKIKVQYEKLIKNSPKDREQLIN